VGYLRWDSSNLYAAFEIIDNNNHTQGEKDTVITGDSIVLGIDPTSKKYNALSKSMALYAAAVKSESSSTCTLFRPGSFSGGQAAGDMLSGSKGCEMAVKKSGDVLTYEIKIPLKTIGNIEAETGNRFGLSIQLNDSDGAGTKAFMKWGEGIKPRWNPMKFGVVYFVD